MAKKKPGINITTAKKIRTEKGLKETKLQRMRFKKRLTQNELASLSNVPLHRIQRYEQQVRKIDSATLDTLCRLCLALNCKIEDILESEELANKMKLVNKPR